MLKIIRKIAQSNSGSNSPNQIIIKGNNPKISSRLIAITIAKSGTHLLYKTLEEFGLSLGYQVPYAYHQGIQLLNGSLGGSVEKTNLRPLYHEVRENLATIQPGNPHQLEAIAGRVFETTSETFRAGQINGWRKYFKPCHARAFKKTANDVLIEFGYEVGSNWSFIAG